MQEITADIVIIGAGTAGMTAYQAARKLSDNIIIIENMAYGTTCARVGCMPSKLLIAAADAAHQIQQAHTFGIEPAGKPNVNGRAVMERVRSERDRFVGFSVKAVEDYPEADRLWGTARFVTENVIEVDDHTRITTRATVIATGSTPHKLKMFEAAGDRLIFNDDLFDWTDLPSSVAVFGAGVIGLELGQALHRLGVRIRLFGKGGGVGPLSDETVKATAEELLSSEFYLDTDGDVKKIIEVDDQVEIEFVDRDGKLQVERFDYLLATTGRTPNVTGIGLENTGIELNERGIPVFDPATMQCSNSSIFIAGDVNAYLPLLHEAADEGRIAGTNAALFPDVQPGQRTSQLSIVFTSPQIALVGSLFSELPDGQFVVGEQSFTTQSRARILNTNQGVMRLYAERGTRRFLGAEMIVPAAEHLAHVLAWAHQQRLTVDEMLNLPFYHPVLEEGLRGALQSLAKALDKSA